MKTTDYISNKIDRMPKGYVFTYIDFDVDKKQAVIKALNRMANSGRIEKISKGKYFKPEKTPFGSLKPNQEQIVKDLLSTNGKIIGYLSGYSVYNKLGLTTQVSSTIQIGKNQTRPTFKRERYTISFIRQNNRITKKSIPLLQILDSIKYIKKIPDTTIKASCLRFLDIIKRLDMRDKMNLVKLSLEYPPSTRALLGALFEELENTSITLMLKESLNPITKYKIPGVGNSLSKAANWNIV